MSLVVISETFDNAERFCPSLMAQLIVLNSDQDWWTI